VKWPIRMTATGQALGLPGRDPRRTSATGPGTRFGTAEALAGTTTIFDGPATSFSDGYINGHRDMRERLAREASAGEAEAGR
jgi:hypothetical protein